MFKSLGSAASVTALVAAVVTPALLIGKDLGAEASTGAPNAVVAASPSGTAGGVVQPAVSTTWSQRFDQPSPPTDAQCLAAQSHHCYTPVQIETAYNLKPLLNQGVTGRGRTIAVVDPFGAPNIASDLRYFDQTFNLPDPPSFTTISPAGTPPPFDSGNPAMTGWAEETTLDVEYAHALAPEANILLVTTPTDEKEGTSGFPEIVAAENYVINHRLADVISQSFGATENTFPDQASLMALRSAVTNAKAHRVTMIASSGDLGATNYMSDGEHIYPYRVNSWPSSDPLVTSVGGTALSLDANGNRTAPDTAWNDLGASGGGLSMYFSRPTFQDADRRIVGTRRGTPDISMSASFTGAVLIYLSIGGQSGWLPIAGTSAAAPMFAGVVALAAQQAHRSLGYLNPALYALAGQQRSGIVDVTTGNNTLGPVIGYDAGRGYDLVTGLGTVDAAQFVPALAAQAG